MDIFGVGIQPYSMVYRFKKYIYIYILYTVVCYKNYATMYVRSINNFKYLLIYWW